MFKSTDGGGTWGAVNTGLTASVYVAALAIDPVTPSTLYAGTDGGGVFKSTDGGGTWSAVNTGLPDDAVVYALAIDPTTPSTLYAGDVRTGGVFKSTDGGGTWSAVNTGLPDRLAASPRSPSIPSRRARSTPAAGRRRVQEHGRRHAAGPRLNTGLPTSDLCLGDCNGSPRSTHAHARSMRDGQRSGGVFKSTTGRRRPGRAAGLTNPYVSALAMAVIPTRRARSTPATDPAAASFASTERRDLGRHAGPGHPSVTRPGHRSDTPSTLYAARAAPRDVFKSTDARRRPGAVNTGLPNTGVTALAIDPATPSTLLRSRAAIPRRRVQEHGPAGARPVGAALPATALSASSPLAIDPITPSTLYAGASAVRIPRGSSRQERGHRRDLGRGYRRAARWRRRRARHRSQTPHDALRRTRWRRRLQEHRRRRYLARSNAGPHQLAVDALAIDPARHRRLCRDDRRRRVCDRPGAAVLRRRTQRPEPCAIDDLITLVNARVLTADGRTAMPPGGGHVSPTEHSVVVTPPRYGRIKSDGRRVDVTPRG